MNLTGPEITVIVNMIMLAAFFGGQVMLVTMQGKTLAKISEVLDRHTELLADHNTRITTIKALCEKTHGGKS